MDVVAHQALAGHLQGLLRPDLRENGARGRSLGVSCGPLSNGARLESVTDAYGRTHDPFVDLTTFDRFPITLRFWRNLPGTQINHHCPLFTDLQTSTWGELVPVGVRQLWWQLLPSCRHQLSRHFVC